MFEFHLEEFPDDPRGHLVLAETLRTMDRVDEALAHLRGELDVSHVVKLGVIGAKR